jgi:hypothetical protein
MTDAPADLPLDVPEPLAKIDRETFSLSGKSKAEAFVLTLCLAYNDLKAITWMQKRLATAKPAKDADRPYVVEWRGLLIYSRRIQFGTLHEIIDAVKKATSSGATDDWMFSAAVDELKSRHPSAFSDWESLVAVASGAAPKSTSDLMKFLAAIRNNFAFHYSQSQPLLRGYQSAFKGSAPVECAFGTSIFETRFCFADEAAWRAIAEWLPTFSKTGFAAAQDNIQRLTKRVHTSLRFLVEFYAGLRDQYLTSIALAELDDEFDESEYTEESE